MGMIPGLAATTSYLPKSEWTEWEISRRDTTFMSRRTFRMKIVAGEKKLLPRGKSAKDEIDEEDNNNQRGKQTTLEGMRETECTRTSTHTKI